MQGSERLSPTWPSAASVVVGVIGDPVAHSLSPLLHNAAFAALGLDWVSVAFRVEEVGCEAAVGAMRALGIRGLSVTMPLKLNVSRFVDRLTATAAKLGSVNCLMLEEDGSVLGDSTDGEGLAEYLSRANGLDISGRSVAIAGAGGAARSVALALARRGAERIVVVNRSREPAEALAGMVGGPVSVGAPEDIATVDVVVQATSTGMTGGPDPFATAFDPALLRPSQVLVDLVYSPAVTPLMEAAREQGLVVLGGIGMLVHQAALQIALWCGRPCPVDAMWEALGDAGKL